MSIREREVQVGSLRLEASDLEVILEVGQKEGWASRLWNIGFRHEKNVRTWIYFPAIVGATSVHRGNCVLRGEYVREERRELEKKTVIEIKIDYVQITE